MGTGLAPVERPDITAMRVLQRVEEPSEREAGAVALVASFRPGIVRRAALTHKPANTRAANRAA